MPDKYNLSDLQSMYGVSGTGSNKYNLGDMQSMFGVEPSNRYTLDDIKQISGNVNPSVPDTFLDEWMPDWIKKGYNESITGMAEQVITGKKRFDLDRYDSGVLEDLGSAIAGFLMPADLAATFAGGGVASLATRSAAKTALSRAVTMGSKRLINIGVSKKIAGETLEAGAKKLIATAATQTGSLVSYTGVNSALKQQIEENDIDWSRVLTDSAKAGLAGAVGGALFGRAMARGAKTSSALAQEALGFGTIEPVLEGEIPEPQDYVNSLGIVLGITAATKLPKAIKSYVKNVADEYSPNKIDPQSKLTTTEQNSITSVAQKIATYEWIAKQGGDTWTLRPNIKGKYSKEVRILDEIQVDVNGKKQNGFRIREEGAGKSKNISRKEFYSVYEANRVLREGQEQISLELKKLLKMGDDEYFNFIGKKEITELSDAQLRSKNKDLFQIHRTRTHYKTFVEHAAELPDKDMFDHILGNDLAVYFKSGAKSFKDKGAISLIKMMDIVQKNKTARIASKINELNNSPLSKIAKDKAKMDEVFLEASGLAPRTNANREYVDYIKAWAKESYDYAGKSGIVRAGEISDYLPIVWRPEVRDALFDDFMTIPERNAMVIGDSGIGTGIQKQFEKIIRNKIARQEFKPSTIQILNSLKKNYKVDYAEAYEMMKSGVVLDKIAPHNSIEFNRRYKITKELVPFLETDSRALITVYNERLARRAEVAKVFGINNEAVRESAAEIYKRNPKEARLIEEAMDKLTGAVEKDPLKNFNPRTRKIFENIMAFEAMSKISLGTATVANLTQTFISTLPNLGLLNTVKGFIKLSDKKYRDSLSVAHADFIREMLGEVGSSSVMRRYSDALAKYSGFTGINKFNNLLSASAAKQAVDGYIKTYRANPAGLRGQYAKKKLKKLFDISIEDGVEVPNDKILSAMSNFSKSSQLQRDFLKEPLWSSDPMARPFIMFKSFGYKQASLITESIKREMKLGNPLIFLRLGLGGMAGGAFVGWSKNKIYSFLSGEPVYKETDTKMNEFIENLGSVGAFGMLTDFTDAENFYSNLKFTLTPPFLSDLSQGFKALEEFQRSIDTFGMTMTPFRRALYKASPIFGSLPRRVAERYVATEQQKRDSEKTKKGRVKSKILDLMMEGKRDLARKKILQWNENHPRNTLGFDDIGYKAIYSKAIAMRRRILNENRPLIRSS